MIYLRAICCHVSLEPFSSHFQALNLTFQVHMTGLMGQDDERKRKAAQFVRKYSQAVARDLPNNSVVQALNDYEMEQVAIQNREADGLMRGFQEWLVSDKSEGFAALSQIHALRSFTQWHQQRL